MSDKTFAAITIGNDPISVSGKFGMLTFYHRSAQAVKVPVKLRRVFPPQDWRSSGQVIFQRPKNRRDGPAIIYL
jgi:hypothetical protein